MSCIYARYHSTDPMAKAFGARVEVVLTDGQKIVDELAVANAHPLGASPFTTVDYDQKFHSLAPETVSEQERERFLGATRRLTELTETDELTVVSAISAEPMTKGIF
jgi:2-methylcitrate dehydratase